MRRAVCLLLLLLTVACQTPTGPVGEPTAVVPSRGKGAIKGHLIEMPQNWRGSDVWAYAASYLGPSNGEGIFVLGENLHPKSKVLPSGWFQIVEVSPGPYVLVFGPSAEEGVALRQDGKALRFEVTAGVVTNVGDLALPR